jgi:hypothetical protein
MCNPLRARVFISCGQRDAKEEAFTRVVGPMLCELGYAYYIAIEQHTLQGLKEAIFAFLAETEYFLFVDFKRDALNGGPDHRGSLFTNQELAIASYLGIEVLPFQENGVKKIDGLLHALQCNVMRFDSTDELLARIRSEVTQHWTPHWRNQLTLSRTATDFDVNNTVGYGRSRFFQVTVNNVHRDKLAVNCYPYLERAWDVQRQQEIPVEMIEHKWRGYLPPNACIPARGKRRFDAFFLPFASPRNIQHNLLQSDFQGMAPQLPVDRPLELTYVVRSENFPLARATFRMQLADRIDDVIFEPIPPTPCASSGAACTSS